MCKRMTGVLFLLFAACTLAAAQAVAPAAASWRTFTSTEGGFTVSFPGMPKSRTDQRSMPGWTLTRHFYELVVDSDRYVVGYTDAAPGSPGIEQRVNANLNNLVAEFIQKGGREIARHDTSVSPECMVSDWKGILTGSPSSVLVMRAVATPQRSYLVMFSSNRPGAIVLSYNYKRFVESFTVTGYQCATQLILLPQPVSPSGPIGPAPESQRARPQGSPGGNTGGGGMGEGGVNDPGIYGGGDGSTQRRGNTGGGDRPQGGGGAGAGGKPNPPDGIYKTSEVTKRAIILSKPEPVYTKEARKRSIAGTVTIRAVLAASGQVEKAWVVAGLPYGL
ncbi:MAG TPA: hypothetical protein VJT82_10050, partial [Pyrinomonadaceae bacterium]|nr:hypothetical protein [Pyrinomonadaceae bacterium]